MCIRISLHLSHVDGFVSVQMPHQFEYNQISFTNPFHGWHPERHAVYLAPKYSMNDSFLV